jgi:hypothetical protein
MRTKTNVSKKITLKDIKKEIYSVDKPLQLREGQFVFNRVDELYGVARTIQFNDRVDCFYDDSKINEFLDRVLVYLN